MTKGSTRPPSSSDGTQPRLVDVVLGDTATVRSGRMHVTAVALLIAVAAHASLWLLARRAEPSLEAWSARLALLVHEELKNTVAISIERAAPLPPPPSLQPPPIAPPIPAPQPPATAVRPHATPKRAPAAPEPTTPAAPAEAAQVLAASGQPEPVDLTQNTFVVGGAARYAGGITAADGTSKIPASVGAADPAARATGAGGRGPSRARAVRLDSARWRCAWPASAIDAAIYQQTVTLRATVRPDGSVASVEVTDDPGFGFAAAAVSCAKRTTFDAARDAAGKPLLSTSPPIRVRFVR